MKIAHVVSLVSETGAFGGPVSVARAQCEELARRGHDVTLFAGTDARSSTQFSEHVQWHLHRMRHIAPTPAFTGLAAPSLYVELRRTINDFDVVHVHLARDLTSLGSALLANRRGRPLVVQTHGMVMPDQRLLVRAVDAAATRRVLRRAAAVAVLTDAERVGVAVVARGPLSLIDLPNGVSVRPGSLAERSRRAEPPVVLFCSRLHPRKRVLAFAQMAQLLVESGSPARFEVAGPDEGDLDNFVAFIERHGLGGRVTYRGAVAPDDVRDLIRTAAVFVLPSEKEPFPMVLLEAMAEGTPAVITTGCMIADRFEGGDGPLVTDGSPRGLADAVATLLRDEASAAERGSRQQRLVESSFSIAKVVDRLAEIYAQATNPRTTTRGA